MRAALAVAALALLALPAPWARAQEAERWSFLGSLSVSRSGNVFLTPGRGPADTVGGLFLSLAYLRKRLRYDLTVTGWAQGAVFRDLSAFNGGRGGLAASGRYSLSPVARFRFSSSLAKGFNPQRLYGTGVLLPQLDVTTSVITTGLAYDASPSTTFDLSANVDWIRYSADRVTFTPQLLADTFPEQATPPGPGDLEDPPFFTQPDSSLFALGLAASEGVLTNRLDLLTYRFGAGVSHDFSERTRGDLSLGYRKSRWDYSTLGDSFSDGAGLGDLAASLRWALGETADLSARYSFQRSTVAPRVSTHTLSGQFDKRFSDRFRFDASLGVGHTGGQEGVAPVRTWVGGVGGSLRFRRGGGLLRLSRTVYQPLGFGRVLTTDFGFVSGSVLPTKKLRAGAFAGASFSRDNQDDAFTFDYQFVGVFVSYRLTRRFSPGLNYAFRRYKFDPLPAGSGSVLGFSISYGRIWK